MRIGVIGTGYVGLVVGTCFADTGNEVVCADVNVEKIAALNRGEIPIYEPGLGSMIKHNVDENRLSFTTDTAKTVRDSEIVFIAVGTPEGEDGSADLQYVLAVAEGIGQNMNDFKVVVDKSTVPVGTAEKVRAAIKSQTDADFAVVSNPEFLKEGAAIDDFLKPDRVVIGCDDDRARQVMEHLYRPFTRSGKPVIFMDIPSAELTKYAANAMLATRISFMNEIARLCDLLGANAEDVRRGMGSDSRIGQAFLFPGVGYGGSCFPKDVKAVTRTASEVGYEFRILEAVEKVNEQQKQLLFQIASKHYHGDLSGKVFAVWGLAFKPKTDDMREAPSVVLIESLLAAGATIRANDPAAIETTKQILGDRIEYFDNPKSAVKGCDGLFVVTEWNEYRSPDFRTLKEELKDKVIFDGRNVYDRSDVEKHGLTYYGIGV
ncbi:MAG: UDPglucose 6-dehydrogenase [Planctomycetota bacterium]|jgi:UDPglucose 6-dehydrogenase